jgi:YVTN family beta-propeller protein
MLKHFREFSKIYLGLLVFLSCVTFSSAQGPVAVNSSTNTIYAVNNSANTVSVINGATNNVTATISVGKAPTAVLTNPNTNTVYVLNSGTPETAGSGSISVINGATNAVTATLTLYTGVPAVQGMAIDISTNLIYVGMSVPLDSSGDFNAFVYQLDCATNKFTNAYSVDLEPNDPLYASYVNGIGVDSSTKNIYISYQAAYNGEGGGTGSLAMLNENTGSTVTIFDKVASSYYGPMAINSTTNNVYISAGGELIVVNGTQTIATATFPNNYSGTPAINAATNMSYLPNTNSNTISVFNGATNTQVATIQGVGANNYSGLGVNTATNILYWYDSSTNVVTVISGATNTITATIPL